MDKTHAPPVQAAPDEKDAEQKWARDERIKKALRKLRWMLGNAVVNANKGIANKH